MIGQISSDARRTAQRIEQRLDQAQNRLKEKFDLIKQIASK